MLPSRFAAACALGVVVALLPVVAAPAGAEPDRGRADCSAGLVSLTFDDGPAPKVTPRLVHTLHNVGVPATFFMVGYRAAANPGIARQVERAGFLVANHSYRHQSMSGQSTAQIRATIRATDAALRRAGVHPMRLVRPPYGAVDGHVHAAIRGLGKAEVLWDIDPRDWEGGSSAAIAARTLGALRPHARNIVLLHDGVANSPNTVGAVPTIVRRARARGFCFVGLNEAGRPGFPTPRASLSLEPDDRRVREGGTLRAVVTLDRPAGRATSVRLQLKGDTASLRKDVKRPDQVVRLPAGGLTATVTIPVVRDGLDERTERFELRLAGPDGVAVTDTEITAVIDDRDPPPDLAGEDRSATEPADGAVSVPVVFRLERPSAKDVRLSVQTVVGTADSTDFVPLVSQVTIPAGQRQAVIGVTVLADDQLELAETFRVHVSSAVNARIRVADAVVTIDPSAL